MWTYQRTDELYHHGILGMKWGVRRYQNKDGSLTSLGKKRKRNESDDEKEANRLRKKKSYELTNAEIKRVNERRRLEAEYNRLNPSKLAIGAAAVGGAIILLNKAGGAVDSINKIRKFAPTVKKGASAVKRGLKKVGRIPLRGTKNVIKGQMSLF